MKIPNIRRLRGTITGLAATGAILLSACEDPGDRRRGEGGNGGGGGLADLGLGKTAPNAPAINPAKNTHSTPFKQVDKLSSGQRLIALTHLAISRGQEEKLCLVQIDASDPSVDFRPRSLRPMLTREVWPQIIPVPGKAEFFLVVQGSVHRVSAADLKTLEETPLTGFGSDFKSFAGSTLRRYAAGFGLVDGKDLWFGVYTSSNQNELSTFRWNISQDAATAVSAGTYKTERGILYRKNLTEALGVFTPRGPKRLPFDPNDEKMVQLLTRPNEIAFDPEKGWLFSHAEMTKSRRSSKLDFNIYQFGEPGPEDVKPKAAAIAEGFAARWANGRKVAYVNLDFGLSVSDLDDNGKKETIFAGSTSASLSMKSPRPITVTDDGKLLAFSFTATERDSDGGTADLLVLMDMEAREYVLVRGFAALSAAWIGSP